MVSAFSFFKNENRPFRMTSQTTGLSWSKYTPNIYGESFFTILQFMCILEKRTTSIIPLNKTVGETYIRNRSVPANTRAAQVSIVQTDNNTIRRLLLRDANNPVFRMSRPMQ